MPSVVLIVTVEIWSDRVRVYLVTHIIHYVDGRAMLSRKPSVVHEPRFM